MSEPLGRYELSSSDGVWTMRVRSPSTLRYLELFVAALVLSTGAFDAELDLPMWAFITQVIGGTLLFVFGMLRETTGAAKGIMSPVQRQLSISADTLTLDGRNVPRSAVRDVLLAKQIVHTQHSTLHLTRVFIDLGDEWIDAGGFNNVPQAVELSDALRAQLGLQGRGTKPFDMPANPATMVVAGVVIMLLGILVVLGVPLWVSTTAPHMNPTAGPLAASSLVVVLTALLGSWLIGRAWRAPVRRWLEAVRAQAAKPR